MKRFHYSSQELGNLWSVSSHDNGSCNSKPEGLWYSVGDEWKRWCESENFSVDTLAVVHELEIDLSKILVIDSLEKLHAFQLAYQVDKAEYGFRGIKWDVVAKHYSGVEIAPYQYKFRWDHIWYSTWDVASGCIWDVDAILKVSLERKQYERAS